MTTIPRRRHRASVMNDRGASTEDQVIKWAMGWRRLWHRLAVDAACRCANATHAGAPVYAGRMARLYRAARSREDEAWWLANGEAFDDVRRELAARGVGRGKGDDPDEVTP